MKNSRGILISMWPPGLVRNICMMIGKNEHSGICTAKFQPTQTCFDGWGRLSETTSGILCVCVCVCGVASVGVISEYYIHTYIVKAGCILVKGRSFLFFCGMLMSLWWCHIHWDKCNLGLSVFTRGLFIYESRLHRDWAMLGINLFILPRVYRFYSEADKFIQCIITEKTKLSTYFCLVNYRNIAWNWVKNIQVHIIMICIKLSEV